MTHRSWLPSLWGESKSGEDNGFGDLRKHIDTLLEEFDRNLPGLKGAMSVHSNVSETDKEVCVTAELPGVTKDDIEISVSGNRITVKGEKKSESEEKKDDEGRQFHRIERTSGMFERSLALPFEIDANAVNANVKDGVLTVTIAKPPEAVSETKKVQVH